MKIKVAHLRTQGINFVVAGADATTGLDTARDDVLKRVWLSHVVRV